ncbi:MAG: hypothetical protein ABL919_16460 [Methylococcales bacterium]
MIIWVLVAASILAGLWFFVRPSKTNPYFTNDEEFRIFVANIKSRGDALTDDARREMIDETRRLAFAGYDRLFSGAKAAGKSESFAHQAGVLDAVFCVLGNDDALRKDGNVRDILLQETVPFNISQPPEGRSAIAEYLVWKLFPDSADLSKIIPIIDVFVTRVIEDSKTDADPDALLDLMLRTDRFDWQKLAKISLDKRISNG